MYFIYLKQAFQFISFCLRHKNIALIIKNFSNILFFINFDQLKIVFIKNQLF